MIISSYTSKMGSKLSSPFQIFDTECMEFPSKLISTDGRNIYKSQSSEHVRVKCFKSNGYPITNYKVSRIDKFIVIHYSYGQWHRFIYYDENLKYVKNIEYDFHRHHNWFETFDNVVMIDEYRFLCRMNYTCLMLINLMTSPRLLFFDKHNNKHNEGWDFRIDNDKNIIVMFNFMNLNNYADNPTLSLITYSADSDYDKYNTSTHELWVHPKVFTNMLYLNCLPKSIVNSYERDMYIITNAKQHERGYQVVSYCLQTCYIRINNWEFDSQLNWIPKKVLSTPYVHKVNMLTKLDCIDVGNHFSSVFVDDYEKWTIRMFNYLKSVETLIKFSEDILLLLLKYIV